MNSEKEAVKAFGVKCSFPFVIYKLNQKFIHLKTSTSSETCTTPDNIILSQRNRNPVKIYIVKVRANSNNVVAIGFFFSEFEALVEARNIHLLIHGLLSCKMPTTIAHCSNTVPDERPGNDSRPDYKVDIYIPDYGYNYTNVYGEMKPTVNMLYKFTELACIQIPTKKSDLLNFIGHLNKLAFILSVHKNDCVPLESNLGGHPQDLYGVQSVENNAAAPGPSEYLNEPVFNPTQVDEYD
ncbi:uncharacterized protein RHIMIDRAFT_289779 [Rhizopus microsporus ATCC 52813]|uniref:Uncharacterized protein n=1 Tax=Rhizopus microsporus ATCC 52813 TaxID=1340429 RepID=A0A2G4T2V6_RHIZD|nr:uncharacterized protein RHIMIDRAFT_289779 [Rhizopus microsporus ATCC 52813]PHZ15351.1 hypothetical protein RHIMIDRAFT_289779 [Rhizopus microsporus ATCC 52813]